MKVGSLLQFKNDPLLYLLLVEEIYPGLFKCIVFTEDIEQGTLTGNTPLLILEKNKTILAELPLWIYATEQLLEKHANFIAKTKINLNEFISYAETTPIPGTPQGKYIKSVAKALAPINTKSIFEYLEKLEKIHKEG